MESFGQYVTRRLEELKMNQSELSRRMGVTPTIVTRMVHESKPVSVPHLTRMAEVFGDPVGYAMARMYPCTEGLYGEAVYPIVGEAGAGRPRMPLDQQEWLDVVELFPPGSTVIRVYGNSMADDNIVDGDYVIVRQMKTPPVGQKVVAYIDGEMGLVVKRLKGRGNKKWLESLNGGEWRHDLTEKDHICGAIIGVIRRQKP